jgi:hypothetical protein
MLQKIGGLLEQFDLVDLILKFFIGLVKVNFHLLDQM